MIFERASFKKATPIWEKGTSTLPNRTLLFTTTAKRASNSTLRITGVTNFRVFINGEFAFMGPARAGKGYVRVDEVPIGVFLKNDDNEIVIISTGYNCNSFYVFNDPSFLQAEIEQDGEIVSATGAFGFKAYGYDNRLRRVQRYTTQRTYCEAYDFINIPGIPYSADGREELEVEAVATGELITRGVALPDFERESALGIIECGTVLRDDNAVPKPPQEFMERAGVVISGYRIDELEFYSVKEADKLTLTRTSGEKELPLYLGGMEYATFKMKGNLTGLIVLDVECHADTELVLTFDEILSDGKIDYCRGCSNVIFYKLKSGKYRIVSAEPYTYQYLNAIVTDGSATVSYAGLIRIGFNERDITARLNGKPADEVITRIYDAAVETFRQNTFDIYMDCPSRERAGWLCDSFFTSRVERLLTGKSRVEHSFLSNFIMAKHFNGLPVGTIPMCYPSEPLTGIYIPNWEMWYVLELKEYLERSGDRELIDSAKTLVYNSLNHLRAFENKDGLLEKLEGWVFIEWSKSNGLTQDINYPSNMLYCMFKRTIGELYSDKGLIAEADALRTAIRERSRYGLFFCDNSVYGDDGAPRLSGECTESCQYYAFFTGVATKEEDAELWQTLVDDFGPERKKTGKWPKIYFANAFIGNYLRLELLCRAGYNEKLEENIRGYFDYMAIRTGTLWEHDAPSASCNHGFASHVLVWLEHLGYIK